MKRAQLNKVDLFWEVGLILLRFPFYEAGSSWVRNRKTTRTIKASGPVCRNQKNSRVKKTELSSDEGH